MVDSAAAMQNGDFTGVVVEGAGLTTRKFQFVNDIWSWVKNKFSKLRGKDDVTKGLDHPVNISTAGKTPEEIASIQEYVKRR